jgi:hypothetical protein
MKTRNVGEITFGVLDPSNAAGWKLGSFMGKERVELLRKARNQQPLPEGVVLAVQVLGGYRRAVHADVDWSQFDWYEERRK